MSSCNSAHSLCTVNIRLKCVWIYQHVGHSVNRNGRPFYFHRPLLFQSGPPLCNFGLTVTDHNGARLKIHFALSSFASTSLIIKYTFSKTLVTNTITLNMYAPIHDFTKAFLKQTKKQHSKFMYVIFCLNQPLV